MVAAFSSAGVRAEGLAIRLNDAASAKDWTFFDGREFPGAVGGLEWIADQGHDAPGCLGLNYDFTGGGNYVQASMSLPAGNTFRAVKLWLNKPAEHRVTIRCTDVKGQTFQKSTDYHYEGWQALEVDLATWDSHWGGPGDGRVSFPITDFGILIENSAEPRRGVLLVDDVEFLSEATSRPVADEGLCTYVASDFRGSPGWGAEHGSLTDGLWSYAASAGQTPRVHSTFSFLGRPRVLRLVVDSDVAGPELGVDLLSHFQAFHRTLGRLEGKGKQTLEVPLDDMSGWEHSGGQDDGVLRLPLRMQQIRLIPKDGPAEGRIRLLRLEIDTVLARGQTALLVPDVRAENGQVRFQVQLSNLVHRTRTGRLICQVRSLSRRLHTQTFELTLPAQEETGSKVEKEFVHPFGGHHMLEASWTWQSAEGAGAPVSIGIATAPDEPVSTELDPASPVGMGLYLYRWRGNPSGRQGMDRICDLAAKAGVKWAREEFVWNWIEPSRGQFDWSYYDQVIDAQRSHGISTYGLLTYWSSWTKSCTPEGIADYCAYVRQVVRRYKDRIRHWEIWNEPNIFFWSCEKELYPQLLAQVYDAIKEEDPQAQVMGCSTSGIDTPFIKMTMTRGGKFDLLSIHPYRGRLNDAAYLADLEGVSKLVNGRPLWLTEIGFPSELIKGWSERSQASLLARIYLLSIASGLTGNVAWYDFRNDGSDPFEAELNFGVVREDLRPKPAYRTLATLGRALAGLKPAGRIDVGENAYAFRFTGVQRDVIAVCAPQTGRLLSYRADDKLSIVDAVGEPVMPLDEQGRKTVTLDGGFPLYVEGPPGFAWTPLPEEHRLTLSRTTVRAGGSLQLKLEPALPVVEWDLPVGWSDPVPSGDGGFRLTVPSDAGRGPTHLQMTVRRGATLRVPATIFVQPAVVRF